MMGDLHVIGLLFSAKDNKDNKCKDNEYFGGCHQQREIEMELYIGLVVIWKNMVVVVVDNLKNKEKKYVNCIEVRKQ